uniref:bifunctional arginine demethylase and lysyl-hydroxylase JMJD6-like isoform X2 n=1 Tax=Pristiophorus japonicus TaxID=55135 RepID=UPI00398E3CFB
MAAGKLSREEVGEMVALALRSGLTERDIAQLPAVHKLLLSRGRSRSRSRPLRAGAGVVLLPLLLLLLPCCGPLRHSALRLCFWLRGSSADNEPCVVGLPDFPSPFRRPLDCRVCSNITAVDRRSNLSHEEFLRAYAYSMQPVVVEDGQRNWSAREVFSFEFFTQIYGSGSSALDNSGSECQFFPYDTEFVNLGDVFGMGVGRASMHSNTKPWYIGWSNCDSSAASILRQHYQRPYFIPAISESSKMDWIFMGVPGHGAHMHIDDVDNPSWQAQIRGIKHWKLEPPAECYYECSSLEAIVYPGQIICR